MSKTKICRGCYQPFIGRSGAKTCSARCRKRLQRTRQLLVKEVGLKTTSRLVAHPVRTGVLSLIAVFGGLLLPIALSTQAVALAQGYVSSDSNLKKGTVVTLSPDSGQGRPAVARAQYADADKVIGVVVDLTDGLATEAPAGSQVYVEQSGRAKAYVSDLNEEVKKGDLLTLSTVSGVLMRSSDRSVTTAGTALEDFSSVSGESVSIKDSNGNTQSTKVALIDINVNVQPPSSTVVAENSNNILDKLSTALIGREVNGLRILAALAIFSTLLVIEGEIIYGTITSSITAVGRNPLARSLIGRESLKSATVGIIVLIIGTGSILVLLWA